MNEQTKAIIDRARAVSATIRDTVAASSLLVRNNPQMRATAERALENAACVDAVCDALKSAERRAEEAEELYRSIKAKVGQIPGDGLMVHDAIDALTRRAEDAEAQRDELTTLHRVAEARERRLERELLAIWATVQPGNPAPLTDRDVLYAVEDVQGEAVSLRAIIADCAAAIGNGSSCTSHASVEFMAMIPAEIRAEVAAIRDRAGLAEGREAAAKANAEQMAGWLDARNAGLVQMARERDALREKLAAVEAKVARMVARVCAGCHGCGLAHLDGGSPRCDACGGNGAVIVDGVTVAHALTVAEVQRESYDTARAKGWHEEDDQPPSEAMMRIAAEGLYQSARCRFIEAYRRGERGVDALAGVDPMGTMATLSDRQVRVIAWMALVNTEVAEAIEDVVAGRWGTTKNEKGKPDGLGSELADIVIRVCDSAGALGIDMEAELRAKLAFNRTRSHKHGGKLA